VFEDAFLQPFLQTPLPFPLPGSTIRVPACRIVFIFLYGFFLFAEVSMKVVYVAGCNAVDVHHGLRNAGFDDNQQIPCTKVDEAYAAMRDEAVRLLVIDLQGSDKDYELIKYVRANHPRCTILAFIGEDPQHRVGPQVRKAGAHEFQVKSWQSAWRAYMCFWFRSWKKSLGS
jgi:hypothetical protein